MARKVLALAFRNAIASPGANPGRAVACASGLDEDRLIDIRNDEGAGSSCECNSAIGCYMSTKNSNCVECCTPNGAYKAPAPDSSVAAPKKGGVGYLVAKRVFDIAFSAGVCLVLAVPVAVACAAICVDTPGKPFFRQERIGQGGKKIYIFKLRTMVSDAHDHPERYMSSAQLETWRREQKLDDDPRITRVGRILRRTSLASVIIGTPGAGEPTNSLSSAAKTSFDQQFYDRRPEVSPATQSIIPAPNSCLFTFFGGSRKAQYELEARADGADQGGSPWRGKASSSMIEKGAYCLTPALGVAA